ncbi:hypothetical protein [Nocardioides pacificus]
MTATPEPEESRDLVERLTEDVVDHGEAADADGPSNVSADDAPHEAEPPD